jgi:hypothetical protein
VVAKWIREDPKTVLACFAEEDHLSALAALCKAQLTEQTFQRAAAIEGVLRDVLGCASPWERAARSLSSPEKKWTVEGVKTRLDEFVERRNNIVHKGDLKPGKQTTQSIRREYVKEAAEVIRAVGKAVSAVVDDRIAQG